MSESRQVAIVWQQGPVTGSVEVAYGKLALLKLLAGKGKVDGHKFSISSAGPCRLLLKLDGVYSGLGAQATRISVATKAKPFTFFLRDVNRNFPILIAAYGVAVTEAGDGRSYAEIAESIRGKGLLAQPEAIENAPEESYAEACRDNRDLECPTWLGLSRDMRIFEVHPQSAFGYWGYIRPRYHSVIQRAPEAGEPYKLNFVIGPGSSCRTKITRRLEEGSLPILRSVQEEDGVRYELTLFVTLEKQPLSQRGLRGSDWLASYANTGGNMLTPQEKEELRGRLEQEMHGREEETVCWVRIDALNQSPVPRYAWFQGLKVCPESEKRCPDVYDGGNGLAHFESGRVFGIHRLNGKPAPQREIAVLVQPGEHVTYELLVPHQAVSMERAKKLAGQNFEEHLAACRKFWKAKLENLAAISVPEPAIDERIKAGLLHCDLVALGREPRGSVLATIGWYSPIGSESAPIIQFFDSMGWHDLAERSLAFFLDRQRDDGFIQNFAGYQLETGPVLWSMGEHYRYTRDQAWVRRIQPRILKACEYLLAWRDRNRRRELRGKGYGLLDGKVADPEDFFHSFMLNALSYLGIQRVSEMLAEIAPKESKRLAAEAAAFRRDIRNAFYEAVGRSPAIPLDDGSWVPSVPPWSEYPGALALFADGGDWFTHGTFHARDSLIGSLYLVIGEVLGPNEAGTDFLLKSHQQLATIKNGGLSQPYYCRHDYIHLLRGEVKAFLKTYYNQFSSLQDRQTYTFWEHYCYASQHKTHEEGWFLMQTRWMLWQEEGAALRLLRAIPRRWMEDGKKIALKKVATYFGPLSLTVESRLSDGRIEAVVECPGGRRPKEISVRLPHPDGRKPISVSGGSYDSASETVCLRSFPGKARVTLLF